MKAFVINVIGDVGLVLAAFPIFRELGVFNYRRGLRVRLGALHAERRHDRRDLPPAPGRRFAKSAQLPLHTWLPDAMEGSTPVSALIHAATMVTAGVYLIARCFPLFDLAPTAADVAAFIGLATLLVAATIALVVTDLKRIIAYSTMSQIGYMVVGVSIGAYTAGIFHLMTHAFFKALLFMAAGSVIAAMASRQDIDRMSGFRRALPFTSLLLIVGALALAGFPGTSGSSSATRSWCSQPTAAGCTGSSRSAATSPRSRLRSTRSGSASVSSSASRVPRLASSSRGTSPTPSPRTRQPARRGHRRRLPGARAHIAEREVWMRISMAILGVLSLIARIPPDPGGDGRDGPLPGGHVRGVALAAIHPRASRVRRAPARRAGLLAGIGLAYGYVVRPGVTARLRSGMEPVHDFLKNSGTSTS